MTRNHFGRVVSIPIVLWSTAALVAAVFHAWSLAEWYGVLSWAAVVAQIQWGRS